MVCSLGSQSLLWCLAMQILSVECANGLEISVSSEMFMLITPMQFCLWRSQHWHLKYSTVPGKTFLLELLSTKESRQKSQETDLLTFERIKPKLSTRIESAVGKWENEVNCAVLYKFVHTLALIDGCEITALYDCFCIWESWISCPSFTK